jgi:hypothetical protein
MKPVFIGRMLLVAASIGITVPAEAQAPPTFTLETIDSDGDTGRYASIAIDPDGAPHVGYYDSTRRILRYAHRTESGWSHEDVVVINDQWGLSFALRADGTPFFTFIQTGAMSAMRAVTGWRVEFVGGCNGPSSTALAAASDGSMHACVLGSCSGGSYYGSVDYATYGNGWTQSNVARYLAFPLHGTISIAARNASDPHISLSDVYSETVSHFQKSGDLWVRETIGPGTSNSIALDAAGVPYVALYDKVARALKLGVRGPQGWSVELVDGDGDVGSSCDLAIGVDGTLHIAYYDATHGDLKYAMQPPGATQWTIQVVASEGDVGSSVGIAVDAKRNVHIAFYDRSNGDLEYAVSNRPVAIESTRWGRVRARYR